MGKTIWTALYGLLWGFFWLPQFAAAPDFPLCAAAAAASAAAGSVAARLLSREYRKVIVPLVMIPALAVPGNIFGIAAGGAAFGLWVIFHRDSADEPMNFTAGFLAGGLGSAFVSPGMIPVPLLCGMSVLEMLRTSTLSKKISRPLGILYLLLIAAGQFCHTGHKPSIQDMQQQLHPEPVAALCALGLTENNSPKVLVIGMEKDSLTGAVYASLPFMPDYDFRTPKLPVTGNYDLIFIENFPLRAPGFARRVIAHLNSGGIIVIPAAACTALPGMKWTILPGSSAVYAAALKDGKLRISPEKIDEQLAAVAEYAGMPDAWLPGALPGMLVDFEETTLQIPENTAKKVNVTPYFLCLLPGILILLELLFSRFGGNWAEQLAAAENGGVSAMFAGLFFSYCELSYSSMTILLSLTLVWFFFMLPLRHTAAWITGLTAIICGIFWLLSAGKPLWAGTAALLLNGTAFSAERYRAARDHSGKELEIRNIWLAGGAALGFLLSWALPEYTTLPMLPLMLMLLGLRGWLMIRN